MTGVEIAGVGLHPFGRFEDATATSMGVTALRAALDDAGWSAGRGPGQGGRRVLRQRLRRRGRRAPGARWPRPHRHADRRRGGRVRVGRRRAVAGRERDPLGRARRGDRRRHREDAQGDHPLVVLRAVAGAGRPRRDARLLRAAGAAHDGRPRARPRTTSPRWWSRTGRWGEHNPNAMFRAAGHRRSRCSPPGSSASRSTSGCCARRTRVRPRSCCAGPRGSAACGSARSRCAATCPATCWTSRPRWPG